MAGLPSTAAAGVAFGPRPEVAYTPGVVLSCAGWNARKMAAFEKALHAFWEGRPHIEQLAECNHCELEALRASGIVDAVRIVDLGDACGACAALEGRTMGLLEALKAAPLPVKGCSCQRDGRSGWCHCEYAAVVR